MTMEEVLALPTDEKRSNAFSCGKLDTTVLFFDENGDLFEIVQDGKVIPVPPGSVIVKKG